MRETSTNVRKGNSQGGQRGGQGLPLVAPDARPRHRVWRWLGELAPGGCVVLAVLGRASLVEEVRLEGGRQRQCVDLTQTLLPQGQAHGPAAQIHEWQGLGWGNQGDRERQVSTALESSTPNSTNNSSNSIINMSFTMQTINE